jgi:hypothetical protein
MQFSWHFGSKFAIRIWYSCICIDNFYCWFKLCYVVNFGYNNANFDFCSKLVNLEYSGIDLSYTIYMCLNCVHMYGVGQITFLL